ncbi:GNAT family N-acetyltransferase [Alkalibacillus haloalkaliphilus]|uniref:GNAT family N-acetyltransferase n=1 Tax=Alkalibacillus haloalkaliphilus TaxID=94136 RepID=UPI0002D35AAC|nr:GNAT family N-acetyltransferase [Alkalibacillus haloalkaliphilus]
MHEVRQIREEEYRDNVILHEQAYTSNPASSEEEIEKLVKQEKEFLSQTEGVVPYGVFKNNKLIGSMKLFDFEMNVFGQFLPTGGLSSVGVDLLHKKERVAKSLVDFYLDYFDQRGYALAALYAFRPDFYYQMGFGYGLKKDVYTVAPHAFPNFKHKEDLEFITQEEGQTIVDCYNTFATQKHGLMKKSFFQYKRAFEKFDIKVVGVKKKDKLTGYAIFSFRARQETNNFLSSNIIVHEFVYTDKDALQQLSTFFHSQKDQVHRISFPTQDETVHHFFTDARDGSDELINFVYHQTNRSGLGLMYRIINVKRFFEQLSKHNFNNANYTITFQVTDSMYSKNAGDVTVRFTNGKPTVIQGAKADSTVTIDISDLSSLVLGVIDFKKLHLYDKVAISNEEHVSTINEIFYTRHKPISMTNF